jgi:ferredoxin
MCPSQCPVDAIMEERSVPENQRAFIRLNAELSAIWPNISERKAPPPDTEEWEGVPDKLNMLER